MLVIEKAAHGLPPEAWIGSHVSVGWLAWDLPQGVSRETEVAWQELFREPAWLDWMVEHGDVIYDDDIHVYLWVEDREDLRSRHTAKGFFYYVPGTMFDPPADVRKVAREIIHGIYTKRAAKAGIPPPPPV